MITKIATIFLSVFIMSACGKRCKDAADNTRTKPKNAALMYIWRYTDNLIKSKTNTSASDSGFESFKPNGDYMSGKSLKGLNAVPDIWFVNNDIIVRNFCSESVPQDINIAKYFIRNDTLFLNYSSGDHFITPAQTFVHYWKY